MPPRQVPAIRSDSEAHAWLKLIKRGRKMALRVLTFPTSRQHVAARKSTFRCSANRMICAFRHEDSGMFQETRNQKPVVISFKKVLKPEQTDEQTIHRRKFPLRTSGHWTGKMCEFRYGPLPSGRARASAPRRSPPATRTGPAAGPWRSPTGPDKRPSGTPAPSAGCCF